MIKIEVKDFLNASAAYNFLLSYDKKYPSSLFPKGNEKKLYNLSKDALIKILWLIHINKTIKSTQYPILVNRTKINGVASYIAQSLGYNEKNVRSFMYLLTTLKKAQPTFILWLAGNKFTTGELNTLAKKENLEIFSKALKDLALNANYVVNPLATKSADGTSPINRTMKKNISKKFLLIGAGIATFLILKKKI